MYLAANLLISLLFRKFKSVNQNTANSTCSHYVVLTSNTSILLMHSPCPLNRYSEVVDEAPPRYPPPPKEDKWGRMDYFFSYHLGIGIIWLFVGFIQIYKAQEGGWSLTPKTNWKAHRAFGRVAIVIVCAHICMMAIMTNENPVNQHPIILFGYCGMIFRSVRHVYLGVKYAREAAKTSPRRVPNQTVEQRNEHRFNRRKHEMYMFYVYARTTVGSGTIRVAAWALWLVGQYLK